MNRRTFLKIAGLGSISFAVGCNSEPAKNLFALVDAPEDLVPGMGTWYASTCRECPAGCGILAKNREARVTKIEGNPLHPINRGRICMRGQAALQAIYNPDRIKTPLLKDKNGWRQLTFSEAQTLFKARARQAAARGSQRVRMLTETTGAGLQQLFTTTLQGWNSGPPVVFEPLAYEALKTANRLVFGVNGLPSYRLEQADVLLGFGADFLETWLSPVEYARKFKAMHALSGNRKNLFFHVSPYRSLTGANADHWLACRPGGEAVVALGLLRQALDIGRGRHLPHAGRQFLDHITAPYTRDRVLALSGLALPPYEKLILALMGATRPLVLGTGSAAAGPNGLQTNLAVNLLNLVLDPQLKLLDFARRHRVETAASRRQVLDFFRQVHDGGADLVLLNNVNPVFNLPPGDGIREALQNKDVFVVSFSNFMDETSARADLILPVRLPLETWGEYGGQSGLISTLQPAMGPLTAAPHLGDVFLDAGRQNNKSTGGFKAYLVQWFMTQYKIGGETRWVQILQRGGMNRPAADAARPKKKMASGAVARVLAKLQKSPATGLVFAAAPSIRFFDGRGANRPWLCEIPDPLTRVAWQSPVSIHPQTARQLKVAQADVIRIQSGSASLEAPVYITVNVRPDLLVMNLGQGHQQYGRYAAGAGANALDILPGGAQPDSGGPVFAAAAVAVHKTGRRMKLAQLSGSRTQHGRKYALSITLAQLKSGLRRQKHGLSMEDFPLTLPLPSGYSARRDFFPAHTHVDYRWAMVVDLDRCIGCGACVAACYAENNVGVVGEQHVIEGREMAWLNIERFHDPAPRNRITFLPMLCQHCDNAPCESVCPVYAPHHSKEGINNQIYNRCIGTRFCSQNCPYKVRRFNWFDWQWPPPLNLQLNPDVTVRSKGVMEKCSFCIQRIKAAHNVAKNEKRGIRDGEVVPACVQTCPTGALVFGSLMDAQSRVRKLAADRRAYQAMGYLNTKPAVIYLKKVTVEKENV